MINRIRDLVGKAFSFFVGSALLMQFLYPSPAIPQIATAPPLVLTPVLEMPPPEQKEGFVITQGTAADPLRYPVSFRLAVSPKDVCTWFLVSSRVLVTAAHCVSKVAAISISSRSPRPKSEVSVYNGRCDLSPLYPKDTSMDWALCLLDKPYPLPTDKRINVIGYEVINTNSAKLKKKGEVEITGFGCTTAGEAVSDVYMVGSATVSKLPPDAVVPGSTERTPNYIEIEGHPSALCGGDSGGPAFIYSDPDVKNLRTVVAINSQTVNTDGLALGYLASSGTEEILAWIVSWAQEKGQPICGIDPNADNCRPTE